MTEMLKQHSMNYGVHNLTFLGRLFFGLGLAGMGITHFVFGDFMTGRAPAWPELLPGKLAWAWLTGALFVSAGIAILFRKKGRSAAILAGVLILLWALLRHIPVVAGDSVLSPAWTGAGKALVFFGGAFAISSILPKEVYSRRSTFLSFINQERAFIMLGQICLGIFLIITGVQHFLFVEFVASLIPTWFPGNSVMWTYFGGVALLAGGIGILIPQTAKLAAFLSGAMVFAWFWIIHIPRTFASVSDGIAVFEALAVAGIAFAIAGFLYNRDMNGDQI